MSFKKPINHHPKLETNKLGLTRRDYEGAVSTLCAGCGHDSISAAIIESCFKLNIEAYKVAKLSGIGCSSKAPAYFLEQSHGFNSVHGRMPSVATGANCANRDLMYLGVSGDGDSASIGLGQFVHAIRRQVDMVYFVENNGTYGLTKGQYSPTSEKGKKTKSTPMGSIDHPFNPLALCMGADATFIARTMDRDPKHMREMLMRSNNHKGTSLLEIYQNCNVFNDGAFFGMTDKATKMNQTLFLEHGQPLVFGENKDKGIRLDGFKPIIVSLEDCSIDDLWIHDEKDRVKAGLLTRFFDADFPRPFGVFYFEDRPTYEDALVQQIDNAIEHKGQGNLDELLKGSNTWTID